MTVPGRRGKPKAHWDVRMKRFLVILFVCLVGAGAAGCALHPDGFLGDQSTAGGAHGQACAYSLTATALAALPGLPLAERLVRPGPLSRLPSLAGSFFQPPERSA